MTQAVNNIRGGLRGRKTYIIMALMVLNGLYSLAFGTVPTFDDPVAVDQSEAVRQILEGLGFGGLRAGFAKVSGT